MRLISKLWVCVSCGGTWETLPHVRPAHDAAGNVLCEVCRLFAGIPAEQQARR